ncbi:MAG: hypothetical protein ACLP1X_21420 [Polyangiaceae bacterium]
MLPAEDREGREGQTTAHAETMLAIAEHVGISLDDLDAARRRLEVHEREYDASFGAVRRNELAQLMAIDIEELAAAYRKMEVAVGRGGEA